MTPQDVVLALFQGALCFVIIALLRIAVVYLGSRRGGLLVGTPMVVFPLFALQSVFGPPLTQDETLGSISSIAAVTAALWPLWLPYNYSPLTVVLTTALCWAAALALIFVTSIPAALMSAAIIANAVFILGHNRSRRSVGEAEGGKLTEAAIPTAIFMVIFFLAKQFVPDFVRGVMAMLPLVLLATLYFVRSMWSEQGFRDFVGHTHSATLATAMFVITVHFSLGLLSIPASLALGLLISILTSVTIGMVSRASSAPLRG